MPVMVTVRHSPHRCRATGARQRHRQGASDTALSIKPAFRMFGAKARTTPEDRSDQLEEQAADFARRHGQW